MKRKVGFTVCLYLRVVRTRGSGAEFPGHSHLHRRARRRQIPALSKLGIRSIPSGLLSSPPRDCYRNGGYEGVVTFVRDAE
jgi:hypothetical protein